MVEIIKQQMEILNLKSMTTEMKNLLKGINSKFEPIKERMSKLKNRSIEIIQLTNREGKG